MTAVTFDFAEFIRQVNEHHRRTSWSATYLLVLMLVVLLCPVGVIAQFDQLHQPLSPLTGWRLAVMCASFAIGVAGFIALCWFAPAQPQFSCPACQRQLGNPINSRLVIATGCCPKCFHSLLESPERCLAETVSHGNLITREEFQRRRKSLGIPLPIVPLCIGLFTLAIIGGWLQRWKGEIDEITFLAYFSGVILACGVGLIGYLAYWSRQRSRKLAECSCPVCHRAIVEGPLPSMTGNCTYCGAQAIADPPQCTLRSLGESPLKLADVKSRGLRALFWGWLCCLIGSIPAVAIAAVSFPTGQLNRPATSRDLLWFVGIMALQISGIALAHWIFHRLNSVKCPKCQHDLTTFALIVISSRNCPCCATRIVAD